MWREAGCAIPLRSESPHGNATRGHQEVNNERDNRDQGDFLFSGRLVPIRREGNIVYARSLRRGEEDTGEGVHLERGDRLVGEFVVNARDIDEHYNSKGLGGYRSVANTVWTWHRLAQEELGFVLFVFALARRTDAAHTLWASVMEGHERGRKEGAIAQRQTNFNSLAAAEMAVIALGRCYQMVCDLSEKYCPALKVPDSVKKTSKAVLEMRNAFEHIDERAEGIVGKGKVDEDAALTIFRQPDFVQSAVLRYRDYELSFESEVIAALIDCRELVINAIEERAKQRAVTK